MLTKRTNNRVIIFFKPQSRSLNIQYQHPWAVKLVSAIDKLICFGVKVKPTAPNVADGTCTMYSEHVCRTPVPYYEFKQKIAMTSCC